MNRVEFKQDMHALGFEDTSNGDRMQFGMKAGLGAPHYVTIRVQKHPQGWWQVTLIDSWETTLLDPPLLAGLNAVRQFVEQN